MKSENLIFPHFLGEAKFWLAASRPKTWIASISPVCIGASVGAMQGSIPLWVFGLCLLFSSLLQIGANWANDYFDFIKGADTSLRVGPLRAVQSGWIAPKRMRNAAFFILLMAALTSIPLLIRVGWSFTPWMLLCVALAIFYTGGKYPLGYLGWGDILVFLFYGFGATSMSAFACLLYFPHGIWIASLLPGSFSCALLCANNLRDYRSDRLAKKMTLVARFGMRFGQIQYLCCLIAAFLTPIFLFLSFFPSSILTILLLIYFALPPLRIVFFQTDEIEKVLGLTAKLFLFATIIFCLAIHAHLYL